MTQITVDVQGVRDTVRALNKIEPGLRKVFVREAEQIAEPAVAHARQSYLEMPLSGMRRQWKQQGRNLFPYDPNAARKGVRLRVDTDRRTLATIRIEQRHAGTAVYETAGRKTVNALGTSLGYLRQGTSRILGPSVYRRRSQIVGNMADLVRRYAKRVESELR